MSAENVRRVSHEVMIAAPAGVVYDLVADATGWPLLWRSGVHVERIDSDGRTERLRVWATSGAEVCSWSCTQVLSPRTRRVDFRQERPQAPVESMSGAWTVEPVTAESSRLTLVLDLVVDGSFEGEWLRRAFGGGARAVLEDMREAAEGWRRRDALSLSFQDSVRLRAPAELVYDFLYRVRDWPGLVPQVAAARVTEKVPGVQVVSVDSPAGEDARTVTAVRLCFPHSGRIVFTHTASPLLRAACGEWSVVSDETGVTVVAEHRVVLRESEIERVLGAGAGVAEARDHVRTAVGRFCTATMNLAAQHAGAAVRML